MNQQIADDEHKKTIIIVIDKQKNNINSVAMQLDFIGNEELAKDKMC